MNVSRLQAHLLTWRLALSRFGWINALACALCLAAGMAWAWGVPRLRTQIRVQQQATKLARQSLSATNAPEQASPRPLSEERLANFYASLGERHYAEQQVKTLFAIAGKTQLTLSQAEYKLSFDKNGRYHAYRIMLPVKGGYESIRRFCEQTLLAIPFASLDEVNFKRDAIGSPTLEAKLRFTLYLADEATPATRIVAANEEGAS